jgi:hypothetical protein
VLRCERVALQSPRAQAPGPLLACRFQGAPWDQSAGFVVGGVMYLDDTPGLWVGSHQRGLWSDDEMELERRPPGR